MLNMLSSIGYGGCFIFGSVLIAIGGLITTHGWNLYQVESQKKTIWVAVEHEHLANGKMIRHVTKSLIDDNASLVFPARPYHYIQLTNALTSGVLSFQGSEGEKMREAMERHEQAIGDFNAGLHIVGRHTPGMFIKTEYINNSDAIKKIPLDNVLSDKFGELYNSHQALVELLREKLDN